MMTPVEQSILEQLSNLARRENLSFLLVGGNAINLYSYHRSTIDMDLLIADKDATRWRVALENMGYRSSRRAGSFHRFKSGNHEVSFPVDIVLVDQTTFGKLWASRKERLAGKARIPVPAPLHLIALKLHAARNPERARLGQDIQDIMGLIDATGIDTQSEDFKDVINRYADKKTKKEILRRLGNR